MNPRASAPDDDVDLPRPAHSASSSTAWLQRLGVRQEGHDVLEDDPRTGKVGDVADLAAEIDRPMGAAIVAAMLTG